MDTPPISTLPTPPAPAGADSTVDVATTANVPPDGEFHAVLRRSLAGSAQGTKDAGAIAPDVPGEEDPVTAEETALTVLPDVVLNASESALALLAALPQQAVRPETAPSGAGPGGVLDSAGAGIDDKAGGGNALIAGRRVEDVAMPGKRIARPNPADAGSLRAVNPEKFGETAALNAGPIPDLSAAGPQQSVHAAAQAAYSPAAPLTADPAASAPAPGTLPRIEIPLGAPGWSTALADQLVMFVNEKQQVAELRINPPHLGPVDITLTLSDDKASAVFHSPHAVVREMIESALPRLREVLAESGITLGQASVTADSPRDGSAQAQSRQSFMGGERSGPDAAHAGAASRTTAGRPLSGLVDLFA